MGGDVHVLVKFKKNWADEFDCHGFKLTTQSQWNKFVSKIGKGFSSGFGTNEGWEDDDITERDYTVTPVTQEEYEILSRLFPQSITYGYGIIPNEIYRWEEEIEEEEDEEYYAF